MINTLRITAVVTVGLLFTGIASAASTVILDGVLTPGEYLGGVANGSESIQWYNDHESVNTYSAGLTNGLHWEISGSGSSYTLNTFFEVPGSARRMIWSDGCDYDQGDTFASSGCTDLANSLIAKGLTSTEVYAVLDAYEDNHHGHVKMNHKTQTDSEKFVIGANGTSGPGASVFSVKWQGGSLSTDAYYQDHATSYDWVLANGCDTTSCDAWDVTASIEVQWEFASEALATAYKDDLQLMRLHLSDEARGLPDLTNTPSAVPVPAAVWLMGSALGMLGWMRRKA
jgi:hypothetical protein